MTATSSSLSTTPARTPEASLSEGYVEDGCVECPLHGALFRLTDGAALTLPATRPVRAHRVAVVDGVVRLYPGEAPAAG